MSPPLKQAWPTLGRFLGAMLVASLAWEVLHLPLYTLWREASVEFMAFAVAHCTVGDVMIALATLAAAWLLCGARAWPRNRYRGVAALTTVLGAAYTVYSEWINTQVLANWAYAEAMPVLGPAGTGLSPLLQWLILPPLAFWWAARSKSPLPTKPSREEI